MRHIRILLLSLCALSATNAYAQNPPFSHPSLDSNCYFPQIGKPGEIDTIMGSVSGQSIGYPFIKNLGPKPDGSYGNLFIGNLTPPAGNNYTLSQVETGPKFNLHRMKQNLQHFAPDQSWNGDHESGYRAIHFRDRTHLDLFVPANRRIYLADDAGNYDSTRFAVIMSALHGDGGKTRHDYAFFYDLVGTYATRLTQDTVDDIVTSIYTEWKSKQDTSYLLLFKGRSSIHSGDTLFEDTSCMLYPILTNYPYRQSLQADFRGTGREDLLIAGDTGGTAWAGSRRGDLFFFANDPPFTLEKLAHAINYDTLMARWQNPTLLSGNTEGLPIYFAMRALPKRSWDRSIDFTPVLYDTNGGKYGTAGIYFFRGGPDFGSHRITLDSAAYIIKNPDLFTAGDWPYLMVDAGDMTGTGNRVLYTMGARGDAVNAAFFVTGQALDDKIDMFYQHPYNEVVGDTLTANADKLTDFMVAPLQPYYDLPPGVIPASGSLWLIYGSKQIPVHLNPKFAGVRKVATNDGASIEFSPNPILGNSSVATIDWPRSESAQLKVYDLLGNIVLQNPIMLEAGVEQQHVAFPSCPSGVYEVVIQGSSAIARTNVVVTR